MIDENKLFMVIGVAKEGRYTTAIVVSETTDLADQLFLAKNPGFTVYGHLPFTQMKQLTKIMEKVAAGEPLEKHEIPPSGIIYS